MGPIRIFWASARPLRPKISEMPDVAAGKARAQFRREAQVWSVLNGSRPVPNDALSFSRGWHWDLFQRYNAEAARLVEAYDWITTVDVAAMARHVPTGGWVARPGKPKDCLHGSPAVPWYNSMILNVLDVVL